MMGGGDIKLENKDRADASVIIVSILFRVVCSCYGNLEVLQSNKRVI